MHIPLFVYVGASLPKVQRLFCKFSEFVFQKFNLRKVNQVELVKENGCLIPKMSENSEMSENKSFRLFRRFRVFSGCKSGRTENALLADTSIRPNRKEGVSRWRKCASRRIENRRRQISQIHPKSFILCISTLIC